MKIVPELETERLVLCDIEEKDTSRIVRWRSNPEVYRYFLLQHPLTKEEHLNWFYNSYINDCNRYDWMARKKEDGQAVGVFGVKRESEQARNAEVSYILSPEHQGMGYASEAVEKVIQFAKECWKCQKVTAEIHIENKRSIGLVERLGFSFLSSSREFCVFERTI